MTIDTFTTAEPPVAAQLPRARRAGRTALADPIAIGRLRIRNRLYRAPVLEGAGATADPARTYARHFVPNAEAGVGLIIQGNTIVTPEGRTSPGMSAIGERGQMLALRSMTEAVHRAGARIVIQLGHGGIYAIEGWHRIHRASRQRPPLAPSPLPLWLRPVRGPVFVPSTEEVAALVRRFGVVAGWAREAGYDGVQLAGSNAKLLHQFLSRTYNRRRDRYGGDLAARFRLLGEIREAIAREAGADFAVLLKYPAVERGPWGGGIALEEGLEIARLAEAMGFVALTPVAADALPNTAICRGDYPAATFENPKLRERLITATGGRAGIAALRLLMWRAARRYPLSPMWNRSIAAAVKAEVSLPVFAVGGIRTPQQAAQLLSGAEADMIGIGRPFYTEPALARRFLAGDPRPAACASCNRCIVPQMLGMPGVCYNPAGNRAAKQLSPAPQRRGRSRAPQPAEQVAAAAT